MRHDLRMAVQEMHNPSSLASGFRRSSKYYEWSANLSHFGFPAIVHFGPSSDLNPMNGIDLDYKWPKKAHHKLEILEAGEKTYSEMVELANHLFDGEAEEYGIMRTDLTADVPDVTVPWFKDHTYIPGKQYRAEIGEIPSLPGVPYRRVSQCLAQTIYAGKKPHQTRIYDKVGERMVRYKSYVRKAINKATRDSIHLLEQSSAARLDDWIEGLESDIEYDPPVPDLVTFDQMFGHSPKCIITRVERQLSGYDLDNFGLLTMADLKKHSLKINPMKHLKFFSDPITSWGQVSQAPHPTGTERFTWKDRMVGERLRDRTAQLGLSENIELMKIELGSNWWRTYDKFKPYLSPRAKVISFSAGELVASYRRSTLKQIAA